jgi:hypothetical protein
MLFCVRACRVRRRQVLYKPSCESRSEAKHHQPLDHPATADVFEQRLSGQLHRASGNALRCSARNRKVDANFVRVSLRPVGCCSGSEADLNGQLPGIAA